jgi:hypothetical protein
MPPITLKSTVAKAVQHLELMNCTDVPSKFGWRAATEFGAEQFGQAELLFRIRRAGHSRWSGRETAAMRGSPFCIGGINTFYYADLGSPIPASDRYLLIRRSGLIK